MSNMIRAAAVTIATSLVAVPLALSGTALAQEDNKPTSYIGGIVFNDLNGDGVKQDGEQGVKDVDVVVKGADGKSGTYPTSNSGIWNIKNVASGEYEVSYVDPKLGNTTPTTVKVNVTDDSGHSVSFGLRGGSICGVAWKDANEDGKRQPGEGPLAGRQIFAEKLDRVVVSGADGRYCFENVPAGEYALRADNKTGDKDVLTRPGFDSKFDWVTRTSQPVKVGKGEQVKGIDSGYLTFRPDLKAVQLLIDHGGVTENNTFKVGDVIEVYGSVVANGNAPQGLTGTLTLPEGLRILAPVGGLSPQAVVQGQQVLLPFGPQKAPGVIEFLGARVVVEKEFTGGEIKWAAEGYTTGVEGGFPDVDPANNVLTRKINAMAGDTQGPHHNHGPAVVDTEVKKTAGLANTGVDPVVTGAVGLGVVALGGLVFYAARRRRSA